MDIKEQCANEYSPYLLFEGSDLPHNGKPNETAVCLTCSGGGSLPLFSNLSIFLRTPSCFAPFGLDDPALALILNGRCDLCLC